MADLPEFTLHRYFIWANRMRTLFDDVLQRKAAGQIDAGRFEIETFHYMSYWYSALFVVVEGWQELKLQDARIDALLSDASKLGLLRRYRNGVFHFQKKYFDDRFVDLISKDDGFVTWIRNLNQEIGRWFLEWFQIRRQAEKSAPTK